MLSMAYSLEFDCIWQKLRVVAFNPDAVKGIERYRLGQVNKEFSPKANVPKLSHCSTAISPGKTVKENAETAFFLRCTSKKYCALRLSGA
jgi:hypothetical protein